MAQEKKPKPKRRASCLFVLLALLVLLLGVGTAVWTIIQRWQTALTNPTIAQHDVAAGLNPAQRIFLASYLAERVDQLQQPAGHGSDPVLFTIAPGESANQIVSNLVTAGVVADSELLLNYLTYYGYERELVAGQFTLSPQATMPQLVQTLTQAGTQDIELSFLPGWRLEEMANYLAVTTPAQIDSQEFLAIGQRKRPFDLTPHPFLANLPPESTLEGYLFPAQYRIPVTTTADDLVALMLARFDDEVTPALRQGFGAQGLTLHEAVTLASIVEREGVVVEERPLIASVFHNRLRAAMPLQADPTVQYALGTATGNWWKSPLDVADLTLDSPYNTYQIPALPPGPLANPSLSSLQAVAEPAQSSYLFFVANCDGQNRHLFSVTYEEHQANVARCN
ncbi:MAG: endolytic transglycosylase MltG [Chloroflexota bacterium]